MLAANPAESNRYHVIRRLAVGGMGEIFLARQAIAGAHRLVVLKRLLPELAEDPQQLAMFVDEARIAANLAHPSIVQVHEFGRDADGHFIVMEYVPGHNVARILKRAQQQGRELPVRFGAAIVCELARALDHAHNAVDSDGKPLEIVHRDISPSNVFVSFRGDVKLMDFGIARAANRTHRTNDGSIRGKFAYMAPEQIEGQAVDRRTDVFAAGIVLWELTLGRRLFDAPSELDTIRAALEQPISRPTSIDPYYPPELERIVMHALERDPARRPASAADLATALKVYLRGNPVDRDDLAAMMAELFADDAAEVVRLEAEHTASTMKDVAPTVHLAPAEPDREPRRRSRAVAVIALFVALAAGGGVTALVLGAGSGEADRGTPIAAPLAAAAVDARVRADTAIVVAEPVDAIVAAESNDAIVAATVDPPTVHPPTADKHGPRVRKPPISDAPPQPTRPVQPPSAPPPPPAELLTVALGLVPGETGQAVHVVTSFACTKEMLQTQCKLPPGTNRIHFRVTNGPEFDANVVVLPERTRCFVTIATQRVDCK